MEMEKISQKEKGTPRVAMLILMMVGTAVILTLLLAPWHWMPTEYSEDITVMAVTSYGCVCESQTGQ